MKIFVFLKSFFWIILIAGILTGIGIFSADYYVSSSSQKYIYKDVADIPHNRVGIVLGTAKYTTGNNINLYYKYRIDATLALYHAKKIDYVLISGDNSTKYYDEPTTFKNDLVARGIPVDKIYLDYAGFRTLDSILRAREVFQLNSFTIISQPFHNERAVCIAKFHNIDAIAFSAKDVSKKYAVKMKIREYFARVKMVLDLILGKTPKFLGEKINID